MRNNLLCLLSLSVLALTACQPDYLGKHLFILSGQSNMGRLNPAQTFTPTLAETFGIDQIIIVKSAQGWHPILDEKIATITFVWMQGESDARQSEINTDDLNDGCNQQGQATQDDLHLSEEGYASLGRRFAQAAIKGIRK